MSRHYYESLAVTGESPRGCYIIPRTSFVVPRTSFVAPRAASLAPLGLPGATARRARSQPPRGPCNRCSTPWPRDRGLRCSPHGPRRSARAWSLLVDPRSSWDFLYYRISLGSRISWIPIFPRISWIFQILILIWIWI